MEAKIGNLLGNLSKRKVGRRELIQTLVLTGVTAFASSVLPKDVLAMSAYPGRTAAAGRTSFPVNCVNHLSMGGVSDYAKTRDWYVNLFGMRVVWDNGKTMCCIEMGSPKAPNSIFVVQKRKPGQKATIGHMAFGIPNFMRKTNAIKAEMGRMGLKGIRPDGQAGWMVDTPSGYMVQPVPETHEMMFPGAARPCKVAPSQMCREGWEAGLKNLSSIPKASGKGFRCIAFRPIVFRTPDIAADRDFFHNLFGMRIVSDREGGENPECVLGFGENTMALRKIARPSDKPYCNEFAFLALHYSRSKAEAVLKSFGLNPEPDPELGLVVSDLDGLRVGVRGI